MKDIRALRRLAKKHGWTTRESRRGHVLFFDPDGRLVETASKTPSDYRSIKNTVARLRAAGLPIPNRDGSTRERNHA